MTIPSMAIMAWLSLTLSYRLHGRGTLSARYTCAAAVAEDFDQKRVAARPDAVGAFDGPVIEPAAGFGAQVALANQLAEVLGRARLIIKVLADVLGHLKTKIEPDQVLVLQNPVGRHAQSKPVFGHGVDGFGIGNALGNDV